MNISSKVGSDHGTEERFRALSSGGGEGGLIGSLRGSLRGGGVWLGLGLLCLFKTIPNRT